MVRGHVLPVIKWPLACALALTYGFAVGQRPNVQWLAEIGRPVDMCSTTDDNILALTTSNLILATFKRRSHYPLTSDLYF